MNWNKALSGLLVGISILCAGLLCSCATRASTHPILPADVAFNKDAGRGGELFVTLHLENGEDLLFLVDTGSSGIVLDNSLEPKLGSCYWTHKVREFYGIKKMRLFRAQKLFLGDTPLQTGNWFWTADFRTISRVMSRTARNRPVRGILGMSCLRHYCIQLDFTNSTMRFLDSNRLNIADLGKSFPLSYSGESCSIHENLLGLTRPRTLIDTGCNFDGWLTPRLYQQWTSHVKPGVAGEARSPNGVLGEDAYPDIDLRNSGRAFNGIGLQFLSRHLVTFDFPKRTMYLKRTYVGRLVDEESESAVAFLIHLKRNGQLPGWLQSDKGRIYVDTEFFSGTVNAIKDGGHSTYYYTVVRSFDGDDWHLEKAWQTDASGKIKEEYTIQIK